MSSGIETDYLMFRNTALYNTIFSMYNSMNYIKKSKLVGKKQEYYFAKANRYNETFDTSLLNSFKRSSYF